jgi:type II secretory pathway component GspD/PulD (secretin)
MKVQNLTGASVNQVPVIGNREFVGQMTLRQGESALIAGLTEQTDLTSSLGIPGLSSIGAAALGGNVNRNKQQNEILITVTPRAIRMPQRPPMAFPMD